MTFGIFYGSHFSCFRFVNVLKIKCNFNHLNTCKLCVSSRDITVYFFASCIGSPVHAYGLIPNVIGYLHVFWYSSLEKYLVMLATLIINLFTTLLSVWI